MSRRLLFSISCLALSVGAAPGAENDPLPESVTLRLGGARMRIDGRAEDLKFSPDGRLIAAAARSVFIWDARSGQIRMHFRPKGQTIEAMAVCQQWARR